MSLFDSHSLWSPHTVTCPCGAVLQTDDPDVVKAFIEAHKDHKEKKA